MIARPLMVGIVGDSGSARTTITQGLVRVLGDDQVTHVCTDDYHRFDRKQRRERGLTPLHPDCNYLDILSQHLALLRDRQPVLKPVYRHTDGSFGPPVYLRPRSLIFADGLLAFHTVELREMFDVCIYLEPSEALRRRWKLQRDCSTRGYRAGEVLAELDRREPDSAAFIRPQRDHADIVVAFDERGGTDPGQHLDARMTVRDSLTHPDLWGLLADGEARRSCAQPTTRCAGAVRPGPDLGRPGHTPDRAAELQEDAVGRGCGFQRPLRRQALG